MRNTSPGALAKRAIGRRYAQSAKLPEQLSVPPIFRIIPRQTVPQRRFLFAPFGIVFELYSHSYELIYLAGANA